MYHYIYIYIFWYLICSSRWVLWIIYLFISVPHIFDVYAFLYIEQKHINIIQHKNNINYINIICIYRVSMFWYSICGGSSNREQPTRKEQKKCTQGTKEIFCCLLNIKIRKIRISSDIFYGFLFYASPNALPLHGVIFIIHLCSTKKMRIFQDRTRDFSKLVIS